ncbi:hypothetical protein HWV62_15717 [Athelia sp. TMB]|nr:hypothetical protein HWV62_15717 [Athelia sp. TMB]
MAAHPGGWVIDGDYRYAMDDLVSGAATDIIWLDPPLVLYFPRLLLRTARRLLGRAPPCAPGCAESWAQCLSRAGVLWWCLSQHGVVRARYRALLENGSGGGGTVRRLGGWGGALGAWRAAVGALVAKRLG